MVGERLARHLLESGRVTQAQLEEARRTQGFFGGDLGTHLLKLGIVNEDVLGEALHEIDGSPYAGDRLRQLDREVIDRVPLEIVEKFRLCPFELEGRKLRIALLNPRDAIAVAAVQAATGLEIETWITSDYRLQLTLERFYGIKPKGVKGLSVGSAARGGSPAAPNAGGGSGFPGAEDDPTEPEVGLDGLPLHAELSVEDQIFFSRRSIFAEGPDGGPHREPEEPPEDERSPATSSPRSSMEVDPLTRLETTLLGAEDRNTIATGLIEFCRLRAARCALFAVGREGMRCIAGRGRGFDIERLSRLTIPKDGGTVFDTALEATEFYLGPVPPLPANKDLYSLLGGRLPPIVMVLPILLKGRTVAALYLDNDGDILGSPDVPLMRRIVGKAGLAFEILLLRNKLVNL